MSRAIQVVWLLWLMAAPGYSDQAKAAKAPPRPNGNALKNGGGVPRNGGGRKALGPRLTNPNSPAARLFQATPEERERALEKFPPARQEAIRRNLAWFDSLPKPQQEIVLKRAERLAELPPEKQRAFRRQLQALNQLPQDRRQAVRMALQRLQVMSEEERGRVMSSEQFKVRFSPEEQKIISDLSEVMLPPL